jgi:hypothetical protein
VALAINIASAVRISLIGCFLSAPLGGRPILGVRAFGAALSFLSEGLSRPDVRATSDITNTKTVALAIAPTIV